METSNIITENIPYTPVQEIGVLSKDLKDMLKKNLSNLCAIKGNLLSLSKNSEVKTILITSSNPSEGKTISAVSMAYGLAELKSRVLLVDGNLRCPAIHKYFNVDISPGLTDLALSDVSNIEAERETEYDCLTIMPAGEKVYHSIDIFKSNSFRKKLDDLRQTYDYIIFDGHSVLISSDVSIIANNFDGIIMVVQCEKTKINTFQEAKQKLSKLGGNVLGTVLNRRQYYIPKTLYGYI